jgi:hypothetical protein
MVAVIKGFNGDTEAAPGRSCEELFLDCCVFNFQLAKGILALKFFPAKLGSVLCCLCWKRNNYKHCTKLGLFDAFIQQG